MSSRRKTYGRAGARAVLLLAVVLSLCAPVSAVAASRAGGPVMYPRGVGADLGPSPRTLGVRARAGDDADGLRTGELRGKPYWRTDVAEDTGYLAFGLDKEYLDHLPSELLTLTVVYDDTGSGSLELRTGEGGEADRTAFTGSGEWRTGSFQLSPHDLDPASAGGGEVRLSGTDGQDARDITVASVRVGAVGAATTLGRTPQSDGITPKAGDGGVGLVTGEKDGRAYWQTDRTAPAPGIGFFYMNADDSYVYDTKDTVLVGVDYLDSGDGRIGLQYDSPGDQTSDKFKEAPRFAYGDSGTWKTHTFALDDAIMTNRSNGSDFRITTGDSATELKVAAVRITVVPRDLDPVAGLDGLIDEAAIALDAAREGGRDGQYPAGSKEEFAAAVAAAREVAGRPESTETRIRDALYALHGDLRDFRASAVDTSLAHGAAVTASSSGEGPPEAAADDDPDTGWTSGDGGKGEWLRADLGRARTVDDVRVTFGSQYATDFTVRVSRDGEHFTDVRRAGGTGGDRETRVRFPATTARYVRIALDGYAEGAKHFAVTELGIRDTHVPTTHPKLIRTRYPTDNPVVADIDVRAYGADPAGVKDSTPAITRALYDCQDAGGGTVWLPPGTYRVTDTLEVPAFCSLRGDRRDPDHGGGDYGTVVSADFPPGDKGPVLFRVGGSASVQGVTTYYPRQSATDPVPYNSTFQIPGRAWVGNENYMMGTVSDVTMLNSYRGIGISTMTSDHGETASAGQVHESSTIRNVKGTVLKEGVRAYNGADVGTWENITLDNRYWANAPARFHPPARDRLDAYTRAHGTGFALGDLEWDQFIGLSAADYATGIHIVPGQRISFAGSFYGADIRRTGTALDVEDFDSRWGLVVAHSTLQGEKGSVLNGSEGYVKVTDTTLDGPTEGTVHRLSGTVPEFRPATKAPKPARSVLYDAAAAPFAAPRAVGALPAKDATPAIQKALDRAGADGGGTVYLPAGWYRVEGRLDVPAGVELRGSSAGPNRDQLGASGGTVLMAYDGRGTDHPDTAPALITLDGDRAGVRGLRVFYPENNAAADGGLRPYPYTVRGDGSGTYVVDVGLPNTWNGVDMATHRNDGFLVRKVAGAFFRHGVSVGASRDGRIEGLLSNGNAISRVGYALPGWGLEKDIFPQVIDAYMRKQADLVTVSGAKGLTVLDVFGYGFRNGLVVRSGDVTAFNIGTDNLGTGGFTVLNSGDGTVRAANVLRYNGATSSGPVRLFNIMAIGMVQQSVDVAADPADGGKAALEGNETEPGRYEKGATVTATATPAAGHHFVRWTSGGETVSQEARATFTVTADAVYTAHFAAD